MLEHPRNILHIYYLSSPGTYVAVCYMFNIVTSDLQECYDFCEKLSEEHLRDLTETLFVPTSNQHLLKKVVFSKPWYDIIFRNS